MPTQLGLIGEKLDNVVESVFLTYGKTLCPVGQEIRDMPGSPSEAEISDYRKRIWNKDRKPWDGEVGAVEGIRKALWKSIYRLADSRRRGYTASEVRAACLLVALEALNHGAAELGFGNPYDQKRVETNADKLYQSWIEIKTPKSI